MPLTTTQAPNPGPALPANQLPVNAGPEISNAIGFINAGNMFGPIGGIPGLQNVFGWRVDRQNAAAGTINLSVQRNGVNAPSTVASVFVSTTYNVAPPGPGAGPGALSGYQANMRELERAVRRGLELSFASYAAPASPPTPNARVISRYQVGGQFSS